ncbi:hypothetical protein ACOME3_003758 [Neoechinorhynchus agilis]
MLLLILALAEIVAGTVCLSETIVNKTIAKMESDYGKVPPEVQNLIRNEQMLFMGITKLISGSLTILTTLVCLIAMTRFRSKLYVIFNFVMLIIAFGDFCVSVYLVIRSLNCKWTEGKHLTDIVVPSILAANGFGLIIARLISVVLASVLCGESISYI